MRETLEILADPDLVREIFEAEAAIARGEVFTFDEVTAEMRALGRLPP
jgi:antitoxin YefM